MCCKGRLSSRYVRMQMNMKNWSHLMSIQGSSIASGTPGLWWTTGLHNMQNASGMSSFVISPGETSTSYLSFISTSNMRNSSERTLGVPSTPEMLIVDSSQMSVPRENSNISPRKRKRNMFTECNFRGPNFFECHDQANHSIRQS